MGRARIFHLVYHDVFKTGDGTFYLDDSPVLGKNRKEYATLERALNPVLVYAGEREALLVVHGLRDEDGKKLEARVASCQNIILKEASR